MPGVQQNRMFEKVYTVKFPLWQFLRQPIADPESKLILNPALFQKRYQVELLERCWEKTLENQRP
jgi:hypothetical protein